VLTFPFLSDWVIFLCRQSMPAAVRNSSHEDRACFLGYDNLLAGRGAPVRSRDSSSVIFIPEQMN
jgi:hypothetical protein